MQLVQSLSKRSIKAIQQNLRRFHERLDVEIIGRGHTAVVLGCKQFALKCFFRRTPEQIQREIDLFLKLDDCSCVPNLIAYGEDFLVVSRIQGYTFLDNLSITPAPNWQEQLRNGLDHIVSKGIQPRDININNVMFDSQGNPWIIDIGAFDEEDRIDFSSENVVRSLAVFVE